MNQIEKIPFQVDISRVIEVLATQIYQSPLALLRENTQNAYDAVLLCRQIDPTFVPAIEIKITQTTIRVSDNGIGMTPQDLKNHYWQAGSSSKNTPEARAAGVVGTFGIGAMANFGIAEELEVITESAETGERTRCQAKRSTLSAIKECIALEPQTSTGKPGTIVVATVQSGKTIDVGQAVNYIREFTMFLPIPATVNGELASQNPYTVIVPALAETWHEDVVGVDLGGGFKSDVRLSGALSGEVQVKCTNLAVGERNLPGSLILRQGMGSLRTFRSGFGLANTTVHSVYQFGGVADFLFLEPTAGREALTASSMQMLQEWISRIDDFVSIRLAERPESDSNTSFMTWVIQRGRYDLCGHLRVNLTPGAPLSLHEICRTSETRSYLVYSGADQRTLALASEDRPMLVLTRSNPRRQCEISYLRAYCKIEELSDDPRVQQPKAELDWTRAESALAFRLVGILSWDYFVSTKIGYGRISHGLPVLVTRRAEPIEIWLDPDGQSVKLLLSLHDNQYMAFDSMAKDFVRNMIFQRIADLVPSSTRQGAEAFLKSIQRSRELFEYESTDSGSLTSIWQDYTEGRISMEEATSRSVLAATKAVQVIDSTVAANIREVVPDVIDNAASLDAGSGLTVDQIQQASPPIQRLEIETNRKLLTIPDNEAPLEGFRCFLAITDRIRDDRGDFFLQPHKTSVVWGGQRVLLVFEHHSGKFGLYYDIQSQEMIAPTSGGRTYPTCTIMMKNRIFIPIPQEIQSAFIPAPGERKRLEVRCDILYID
jgi:molecular chaperone HtpG